MEFKGVLILLELAHSNGVMELEEEEHQVNDDNLHLAFRKFDDDNTGVLDMFEFVCMMHAMQDPTVDNTELHNLSGGTVEQLHISGKVRPLLHHALYTIPYTPYPIHYTLYTIPHTLYTIHHTPYTIHYTLTLLFTKMTFIDFGITYTIHYTPYTRLPSLTSVSHTPYTIHHTLDHLH
jgi:hypothetical protein